MQSIHRTSIRDPRTSSGHAEDFAGQPFGAGCQLAVLVTGGAGYIGGHIVLGLLDSGKEPIVIDNMSNGVPWAIPQGVRFVQGDIGDYPMRLKRSSFTRF